MRLYEILEARSNVPVDDAFAVLFAGKHKTSEISGVPPISFTSKGGVLEDYRISGNTIQNGTPTPEAPVDVVGCGAWDETHQSYKLPLTVNGTEYPIYLGSCQTTRRIRKLVLTGEENWHILNGFMYIDTIQPDYLRSTATTLICSHYRATGGVSTGSELQNGWCALYIFPSLQRLYIRDDNYTSVTDFVSYLASEYAAGTPVTVWYVLATPETGIVNEPLHKIGDYADTITMAQAGVTIPTVAGENTLTIDTTVQPSSVTIRGRIRPTL